MQLATQLGKTVKTIFHVVFHCYPLFKEELTGCSQRSRNIRYPKTTKGIQSNWVPFVVFVTETITPCKSE